MCEESGADREVRESKSQLTSNFIEILRCNLKTSAST